MDAIDREILNVLQFRLPLVGRPFRSVARRIGISEKEMILRVAQLEKRGIIRRIGATLNSDALGYEGMLIGARVPERDVQKFAEIVKGYQGVTHCYERKGFYNIWFTVQATDRRRAGEIVEECERRGGYRLVSFPARKRYKINFRIPF